MYISRLALDHFRSWEHCVVDFAPGVNILHGANGLGKTNIVEAIEVLSTGSSHRTSSALPLVERGFTSATIRANVGESAVIEARTEADADDEAARADGKANDHLHTTTYEATIAARGANRARINGGSSLYMRDIVGRIPSVSFTPEDQRLVTSDPAMRRRFLDQSGALLIPGYMNRLQTCTRIAKQRAALLKQLERAEGDTNAALSGLEIWTGQFIEAGIALTADRNSIINSLSEPFAAIYARLAGDRLAGDKAADDDESAVVKAAIDNEHQTAHKARLAYEPSFAEVLDDSNGDAPAAISRHFQRIYPGEVARGLNLIGPHRDDMALELEGMPAREFASNGEMWTMALALKMALFEVVVRTSGVTPIVILDDVFAQLDETRRGQILDFAAAQQQVFITVAARSDIPDFNGSGDSGRGLGGGLGSAGLNGDGAFNGTAHANIIDVAQLKAASHDGNDQLIAQLQAMRGGGEA
ncbi:DNA replication/repair protein RecF [Bifidobacterium tibiigranuli]|uniref:DNA replication/repair protein RecF n=1 Tax=Bifidobacterium tibiigranuli TaxID=2172043 RepID=UPI0030B8FD59